MPPTDLDRMIATASSLTERLTLGMETARFDEKLSRFRMQSWRQKAARGNAAGFARCPIGFVCLANAVLGGMERVFAIEVVSNLN